VLTLRRSSIRPVPPSEKVCYICKEVDRVVAEDVAMAGYICAGCVNDAIAAEILMMRSWRTMRMRHPNPDEFNDWDNH